MGVHVRLVDDGLKQIQYLAGGDIEPERELHIGCYLIG